MSEENETPTIDTMLDAIYQKNLSQARHHFDTMMADKIGDALENEKISIASQYYNPQEAEYDESEVPQDEEESIDETEYDEYEASAEESEGSEEEWGDLEREVSNEFEEELEVED